MSIQTITVNGTTYSIADSRVDEVLETIDDIKLKQGTGAWANIEQVFMCHYPFLTSGSGRTDVGPTSMGAYYYQGFCCTPDGFALVRLAPDTASEKVVSTDISQIMEFYADGTFKRAVGVDVHHGNGMCYYGGYLYVDVGSTVAKIDYNTFSIVEQINIYGSCPAVDRENGCFYTASRSDSSYSLHKYEFATGTISTISISTDCPEIYNGSFYKDGILYCITYNNDFVMIDVKTGKFLGGISTSSVDTTGIYLYELEDADCAEDGTVYVMSQQPNFTTTVYDISENKYRLRNVGFYIGKLYINGGASVASGVKKPLRIHRSSIYVKSPATEAEAMNATLQTGHSENPFYSFAGMSFLTEDVREINASGYTTMYFADIYQPRHPAPYAYINGLSISTTYPIAFKGFKGYFQGSDEITITNYGISLVFCDIDELTIISNGASRCIGTLYYGRAELYVKSSYRTYMVCNYAYLQGCNVIPKSTNTQICGRMRYNYYNLPANTSTTIELPYLVDNFRRRYICFSNDNMSATYRINTDSDKLIEIGGLGIVGSNAITCTYARPTSNPLAAASLTFTPPFNITDIEVF